MEVIIQPDPGSGSVLAAQIISNLLKRKPNAVLGLATGNTPLRLYKELIDMYKRGEIDFSRVTTFNLDEYVGLPCDHPASYNYFMYENFFKHVNIPKNQIHIPDGAVEDIPAFCLAYEQAIKDAGGIDLQLLGIGRDGHIGFNEPVSSLSSRTRIKTLMEQTLKDNETFFEREDHIPHHVITMGIGTVMESGSILLLAFGTGKAHSIAQTVEGPLTAMVPASILQLHPHAKIILDKDAATHLSRAAYYQTTYDGKPDWQKF
ncbi:MAG: glucosamine-6-phosphate deaminase [Kiritimatiellae bacterium]|nr:glucosamine-6-phosphate deaminase [Kiritimatiellia bacterium]